MNIPKKYQHRILSVDREDGLIDDCRYLLTFADGYTWNGERSVPCRSKQEVLQCIREAEENSRFLLPSSDVKSEEKENVMEKEKFDKKKYDVEFHKKNYRFFAFKIRRTETEIISWIEQQENMSAYIMQLIREDMERNRK